ncbi:MAG: response regulator [Devosia sp.]
MPNSRSIFLLAGNPAFGDILSGMLRDAGYEVATFTSVNKLTSTLRFADVDVLLLDTDVPGAPAIDIARGIRQHVLPQGESLSIVALTRIAPAMHKSLLAAGIDAVVPKPVVPAELLALLHRLAPLEAGVARAFYPLPVQTERVGNVIPLFGEGRSPR